MSLRKRIARGAFWSFVEKAGQQGLSFLVFAVLARIVGPEEFGLVNLCYIYLYLAFVVIFGIVDGVINLQIEDDDRLSTLFWFVVGLGLLLSGGCWAAARPFAVFMNEPALAPLLEVFSVFPLILSLSAVPTMLVMGRLDFRLIALRTLTANTVSGIVGVAMALKGYGAYALIWQQIVLYVVMNLIIWPGCRWVPRFRFNLGLLAKVLSPGVKMAGSSFVSFIEQQTPRLIAGKTLGAAAVGYFGFVVRIRSAVLEIMIYPFSNVYYPAFVQMKADEKERDAILARIIALTGLFVFPAVAGAAATAPFYIPLFFGAAWEPVVPVLQLFLLSCAPAPFVYIMRDLLRAYNRAESYLWAQGLFAAAVLLSCLVLAPQGLLAMSVGIVGLSVAQLPVYMMIVRRKLGLGLLRPLAGLWASVVGSASLVLAVEAVRLYAGQPFPLWGGFLLSILAGGAVYVAVCCLLQFREMQKIYGFVKALRKKQKPSATALATEEERLMGEM